MDKLNIFESDISYLEGTEPVPFNVYLFINGKFLKIVNENTIPYENLWQKIKEKRIDKVYIQKNDEYKYISYGIRKIRTNKIKNKYTEKDSLILIKAAEVVFNCIQRNGVTPQTYSALQLITREIIDAVKSGLTPIKLLNILKKNNYLFNHSFYRTVLAVNAANKLDWGSHYSQEKIILASMLADISLSSHPSLLVKEILSFSKEESRIFYSHMTESIRISNNEISLPKEVKLAISHHHENADGTGPLGLKKFAIYPLGHLIRIADEIAKKTLTSSENPFPISIQDAVSQISSSRIALTKLLLGFNSL